MSGEKCQWVEAGEKDVTNEFLNIASLSHPGHRKYALSYTFTVLTLGQ